MYGLLITNASVVTMEELPLRHRRPADDRRHASGRAAGADRRPRPRRPLPDPHPRGAVHPLDLDGRTKSMTGLPTTSSVCGWRAGRCRTAEIRVNHRRLDDGKLFPLRPGRAAGRPLRGQPENRHPAVCRPGLRRASVAQDDPPLAGGFLSGVRSSSAGRPGPPPKANLWKGGGALLHRRPLRNKKRAEIPLRGFPLFFPGQIKSDTSGSVREPLPARRRQ